MDSRQQSSLSRRDFFSRTRDGLLGGALTQLLCNDFFGGAEALAQVALHRSSASCNSSASTWWQSEPEPDAEPEPLPEVKRPRRDYD